MRALLQSFPATALRLLALVGSLLLTPALAETQPVLLDAENRATRINPSLEFVLDGSGAFTVDQIEEQPDSVFKPLQAREPFVLGNTAMWMRFDVAITHPAGRWRLAIPMPTLDRATLYYRDTTGKWVVQQAGDHLPRKRWSTNGRYPVFDLAAGNGTSVRYYLRVQQLRMPYSVPPQIINEAEYVESRQNEHTLLGVYFGFAVLTAAMAIFSAAVSRDTAFGIFALHILLFASAQGVYTGMAGLYLWPQSPELNNNAAILLTLTTTATALWFARTVCTPRRYSASLDLLIRVLMPLLPAAGVVEVLMSSPESFLALNLLVGLSIAALVIGIGVALYEGDRDTRWVALGFSPILLAALLPLVRNLGMTATGFWTDYGRIIASMIEVPILFYGLRRRVSQSRSISSRATSLRHADPLTGLYSAKVLLGRMRQALATAERYRQPFAMLMINLANLPGLQKQHGRETADRALVMAASRIRDIADSNDTLARVGDGQFALLLPGPLKPDSANDMATRILASGLRPSNELPDAEPLMFHIAIGFMNPDALLPAGRAEDQLEHMLQAVKTMDDGSRKAIRQIRF